MPRTPRAERLSARQHSVSSSLAGVISSFSLLAAASVAGQAIGFVALMVVSRRIGPDNLGAYAFASNLTRFFAIPANLGISTLAIREVARRPEDARQVAGQVLALRIALFLVAYAALVTLAPVLSEDGLVQTLLPICGLFVLADVAGVAWGLQALQRFGVLAALTLGGQVVYGALVPLLVGEGSAGAIVYAWLNVVGVMVTAVGCWIWFVREAGWPVIPRRVKPLGHLFARAAPIGLSFVMILVYYSLDSVMLGYLRSTYEVAQYAVGYRIVSAIVGFAGIWVSVLFPHAARLYREDRERLGGHIGMAVTLSIAVALPIAVGGTLVATPLMAGLFGSSFADAGPPFSILIWSAAVVLVSVNFGNVLMACDGERTFAIGVTLGAVVNTILNLALIPSLGASGAAAATVATEALVMAFMIRALRRRVAITPPDRRRLAAALLAVCAMAAAVVIVLHLGNVWLAVACGAFAYSAVAALSGVVRGGDLAAFRRPSGAPEAAEASLHRGD